MGYLFVAIALLCGVTKGYCGKKTSGVLVNQSDAMLVNAVRMLACIAVGLVIVAVQNDFASLAATKELILVAILSGVSTAAFTVSWLLSVRQGAYMMVDVFLLVGVMLPLILCRVLYSEEIHLVQWIGYVLVCGSCAFPLLCLFKSKREKDGRPASCTLGNFPHYRIHSRYGDLSVSQFLFQNHGRQIPQCRADISFESGRLCNTFNAYGEDFLP